VRKENKEIHLNTSQFLSKENTRKMEFSQKTEVNLIKPTDIQSGCRVVFLLPD
jgi:hypothetical protein